MSKKVKVSPYKRSTPCPPPAKDSLKPGPKPVFVEGHERDFPKKK